MENKRKLFAWRTYVGPPLLGFSRISLTRLEDLKMHLVSSAIVR